MKTAELTNVVLDWAVAKCEGFDYIGYELSYCYDNEYMGYHDHDDVFTQYQPSTNWAQGGPIIEHAINKIWKNISGTYGAQIKYRIPYYSPTYDADIGADVFINAHGPTPLIAAMRCYVASKLGDEVEVEIP